jgi:hypothetical protein
MDSRPGGFSLRFGFSNEFVHRLDPARAKLRFHLFKQRHASAAWRKILFHLPIPFRRILFDEPSGEGSLLLSPEFGNCLFDGFYGHISRITNLEPFNFSRKLAQNALPGGRIAIIGFNQRPAPAE